MASYDAKINVLLSGLRDLVLLEDRLEKIGGIVNTLNKTPIALNVGGRGKERDLSGQLSKEVNDYVRAWVNGDKTIGKSINAVKQQAAAFQELLRETAMVQQDKAARVAVENLAEAWADTTRAATEYDKKLSDIQRRALGLQPQAVRDLEVARRETFVRNERRRREGQVTAAQDVVNENAALITTRTSWLRFFNDAADLARELSTRTKEVEAAASAAARERLASEAQRRQERSAFLAGSQISQFPIGPNPRSTRRRFEGDTSVERAETALRTKELQQQRNLNAKFFTEEKAQILELDRIRAESAQKQTQRIQAIGKTIRGSLSSAAIGGAFPLLFGQSPQAAVGGAIGGLLGGAGGGFAGSLIGTALGELEAAKARTKELALELGLSSAQAKELGIAFELAGRNSQQLEAAITNIQGLGLSTNETASAIKIAVELSKDYGGSVEKIAQAFADTLESGKVSISTLNKFTAQGIPIQDELAAKFGVSRTKLLEMAKDGQISVQQVTDALVAMGSEAEKTADKGKTGFDRFTQAVTGIATAVASAAGALLKILVPALDTVLTKLAAIITRATQAINLLTDATVGEASAALARSGFARGTFTANQGNINDLTQGLKSLQPRLATTKEQFDRIADTAQRYRAELQEYGGSLGEYAVGTAQKELSRVLADLAIARTKLGAAPAPAAITSIIAPANLPPGGKAGKAASDKAAREAERAAEAAAKEAARVKDVIRNRLAEGQILNLKSEQQDRIAAAEIAGDKMLTARLKAAEQQLDIQYRYAQELAKEANLDAQKAIMYEGQNALAANQIALQRELDELQRQSDQDRLTAVQKYIEKQYELNTSVQNQLQLTDGIANTLGEGIGSAFNALVSGAQGWEQSLQQIASGVLIDIANQLIRIFVIEQAINSIKSFLTPFSPSTPLGAGGGMIGKFGTLGPNFGIPQRAKGGPVMGGSPYVVGERGPELFVPGSSGTIIPNHKMGEGVNVVVNVDASGSRVEGDEQEGKQLGRVIAAAMQAELIKQKRPGGLLA